MTAVAAAAAGRGSHSSISRASGEIVKGSVPNLTYTPTTIGYVGLVHPGQAQAVQNALGSALLAQVTDSASGTVVIARSENGIPAADQSTYFSQWKPVLSQSQQASLQSWDMLLSDRPTAQPIINAAVAAVAQEGYVSSAATLQSALQVVLISDNPVAADSVIVTLLVPGAVVPNPPGASGPIVHSLDAYTVIVQQSTGQPTGVARGGLLSAPGLHAPLFCHLACQRPVRGHEPGVPIVTPCSAWPVFTSTWAVAAAVGPVSMPASGIARPAPVRSVRFAARPRSRTTAGASAPWSSSPSSRSTHYEGVLVRCSRV